MDVSWDNVKRGWNNFTDEVSNDISALEKEWHDWRNPPAKANEKGVKAAPAPASSPEAHAAAAPAKAVSDIPAPDKDGVLRVSADSPNFQKAIEQDHVKKIVIDQPGHVNFQVGLTTDAQNKPIFVGQIYEQQGGKIDKTFALPGNVDYVTINQHNKSADGKNDIVSSFTEVAGQGRLAAFKQVLNSDQFFPGTFEVKPVAGVAHTYPIPLSAGTNDAFQLVRKAGRMNDDLLDLGQTQLRHDQRVSENSKDPWFNVTLAKLDMLAAGKNLGICPSSPADQRDGIINDANSYLKRAVDEYQEAQVTAQTHLPDNVKKAHTQVGQDPRNWHEIPRTQTGALDWSNPQADITYFGSALDLAAYEQRQAQAAQRNVNSASRFACGEDLDRLLR